MQYKIDSDGVIDPETEKKLLQKSTNGSVAEKTSFWFSKRFCVVVLLFFGHLNLILLKVNLNIAIVEMTSKKKFIVGNLTAYKEPEYNWDSKTVGFIQSAYAYGLPFSALGVPLIKKLGGSVTVGATILGMAITNLLTPACSHVSFLVLFVSRIVLGIFDGIAYMAVLEMLSRWAPVPERSTMMSFVLSGIYVGIAVSYPICGFIAHRWGWRILFYVSGIEGIIWSSIWLLVVKNQPSEDKWMSKKEQMYLLENTETMPRKQIVHPYKKIFTSPAVWAMCMGKFTYSWGITLLVMCLPLYVRDMTGQGTHLIGLISSIPNFVCMLAIPLSGLIMDYWQNDSTLTITQIHKTIMSIGFISGSIFFVIASYSTNFILSMACFIFIKFILSFNLLILQLVCLCMSPTHSSILAGVSAFGFTAGIILIPNIVGFLVQNQLLEEWSKCFLLSGAVLFAGAVIFLFYGSSELQSWSIKTTADGCENGNCKIKK